MISTPNLDTQKVDQENEKKPKKWATLVLLIALTISLGINGLFAYQNSQLQKENKISSLNVAELEQKVNELKEKNGLLGIDIARPYNPINNRFFGSSQEPKTTGDYNIWVGEIEIGDFCAVKIYVKNKGDGILTINANDFYMIADGNQVEQASNATAPRFPNEKVELYPGYEMQGYLTFKIEASPEILELKFQPDDLNLESVILEVYDSSKIPEAGE